MKEVCAILGKTMSNIVLPRFLKEKDNNTDCLNRNKEKEKNALEIR